MHTYSMVCFGKKQRSIVGPIFFSRKILEAKVQLIELEKVQEEKRQMFFQQQALKQAIGR